MTTQIKNIKKGGVILPQKLYTQQDVNTLLEESQASLPSQARQLEQEDQTADKLQRLENETVAGLVKKSNRILVSISTHALPFDLFPNTMNVEEGRITIINRYLFSSEVHSIDIKNISNILINSNFIFSQLVIISKTFEENEIKMRNLRTKEAVFARRIIEGLRIFNANQIDTSVYTKEKLIAKLQELSKTKIVI